MGRSRTVKSVFAGMIAGTTLFTAAFAASSANFPERLGAEASGPDENGIYFHDTFEEGSDGWTGRGGASVSTGGKAYAGSKALTVTGRDSAWQGAMKTLDAYSFKGGEAYSFSVLACGSGNMMLSLQYKDTSGTTTYGHIANMQSSGEYVLLHEPSYKLPEGSDYILYVETEEGSADFSIDEVTISAAGTPIAIPDPVEIINGDLNSDGVINVFDLIIARRALFSIPSPDISTDITDVDGDGFFAVNDIVVLNKFLLGRVKSFPKATATTTTTTTTTTTFAAGEYMNSIRDKVTPNVPQNVLKNAEGTIEHITYFSKKANRNKGANVWLPPGYDKNKKYPVFYVNHGYGGDEGSMVNGMGIREIATNLIKSGDAVPMIIVFTNQYTDPQHEKQTGNGQADVPGYDNFVEDFPDSLMPYIESHYPVKTGRENTAIAGFSMGGREALYIGIKCCDKVGYIGGGAPAPGIFPTRDAIMNHPGVMSKDDMRIDPPYSPYLLMIAGGTNDGMVSDYPKQYSDLFTQHGTDNIFISVPGGNHDSSTVTPLMYNFIRFIFKAT